MKKSFTYLIYTNSSKEHNIFFYKNWKIDEDLIVELKSTFSKLKYLKIIVFDSPIDNFNKERIHKDLPTINSGENVRLNTSFIHKFIEEIDTETIKKYGLYNFKVSKNLVILNRIKSIISEKSNIIWTNELGDCFEHTLKFKNLKIVEDDLLYDFVNKGFSKKCFGLQIKFESPYEQKTFKSFLNNQLLFFPEHLNIPINGCQYTFSIEKTYPIESDNYGNGPLKISLFKFTDIPYKNNKTYDTIFEDEINVFGWYDYEQNKYIYFFLIEESLFEKLNKIRKMISDTFCVNWIDEYRFSQEFKNIMVKQKQIRQNQYTSTWSNYYLYGLELRYKKYYQRYSDFGSDNNLIVVNGDSRYLDLINKKPIYVACNPGGIRRNSNGTIEPGGEYFGLEENIFEYFFENKKFLVTNIDNIHYRDNSYTNYGLETNKKSIVSKKVILIPEILFEDSFILTQDYFPYTISNR
jgi:hypothetical protein